MGGVGPSSGTGAATSGGTGSGTGADPGTGTTKGKPSPTGSKGGPFVAERTTIAIPPSIQRTTSPYESEVYAQVDFYTLYTPDLRANVNVPANLVCLDGNIIRTLERQVISQRVTDISKCRYEDAGDDQEKMRCPPDAHTTVVTYNNFLSSPVTYNVNICLLYERSNCHMIYPDDGPEREICRDSGKYEGIWAESTMFHYRCTKSASQTFSHPLQYEVRFLQDVEFPDELMRRRLVHREKRPLLRCE